MIARSTLLAIAAMLTDKHPHALRSIYMDQSGVTVEYWELGATDTSVQHVPVYD